MILATSLHVIFLQSLFIYIKVIAGPVIAFGMSFWPEGASVAPSIFLFPELATKHEEQKIRYVYFTWFEVGNWLCFCLWIVKFFLWSERITDQ